MLLLQYLGFLPASMIPYHLACTQRPETVKDIMRCSRTTWDETGRGMTGLIFSPVVSEEIYKNKGTRNLKQRRPLNQGKKGGIGRFLTFPEHFQMKVSPTHGNVTLPACDYGRAVWYRCV
jgi:hypothetical protein